MVTLISKDEDRLLFLEVKIKTKENYPGIITANVFNSNIRWGETGRFL